jgi:hypothetical protein
MRMVVELQGKWDGVIPLGIPTYDRNYFKQ